jgi:hypothetical protein
LQEAAADLKAEKGKIYEAAERKWRDDRAKEEADPVAQAIRAGRLAPGMTLAQANSIMKKEARLIGEQGEGVQEYEWDFGYKVVWAYVVDGKLTSYQISYNY